MGIGFIGLGNLGGKLARSVLRGGFELTVHDLDPTPAAGLVADGATWAHSPAEVAAASTVVITCLPSPVACAAAMEGADGVLAGLRPTATWIEMSPTDDAEVPIWSSRRDRVRVGAGGGDQLPGVGAPRRAGRGFTLNLVRKDTALFAGMAARGGVELDLAPVLVDVFADAIARYGSRERSTNVVRRLEDATGAALRAPGFPAALVDDVPPAPGREVVVETSDR